LVSGRPAVPDHTPWASVAYNTFPSGDATPRGKYAALVVEYVVDTSTMPFGATRAMTRAELLLSPQENRPYAPSALMPAYPCCATRPSEQAPTLTFCSDATCRVVGRNSPNSTAVPVVEVTSRFPGVGGDGR